MDHHYQLFLLGLLDLLALLHRQHQLRLLFQLPLLGLLRRREILLDLEYQLRLLLHPEIQQNQLLQLNQLRQLRQHQLHQ
jgi:hypothetical protein